MKIIILGAGQVGGSLAESLASERNDIVLVDSDEKTLRELRDRLDIGVVIGHAAHPNILLEAGIEDADILVAVTNNDETNMVACQIAHSLFRVPTKIARVRAGAYLQHPQLFDTQSIPIDVLISPEHLVSEYVARLIEHPGALQVLDFADGRVQLVAVRAVKGGPLVGRQLRYLREHMPKVDTRVAAIYRRNTPIIPQGDTVIEAGDEVFFIAARANIRAVMSELRRLEHGYKRVTIAGGGNIGLRLAHKLENRYAVKIIEQSHERCVFLSEELSHTIVLNGSASDQDLLLEENIEDTDVFLAVTNDDEANIMSSLLAKRLGARKVMTLINNRAYVDLVQGGEIDIAISPQQNTIGSLLTHVRRGDMVNVHSLRRGAAEAIEVIAHGDKRTSKVVGRKIEDIDLPEGASIGAIVRETEQGSEVLIAHDDVVVETNDHVIVFLVDRRQTRHVEQLFQVGFSFF
ncbi:Trk system potassium transporter TrkA [Microbulbifer thermotolerans]|uniref:Trk system potassium uptake protein TrkA n=1 Tax=Microbulbifer thermotolerans TaxID=252514 RepID=A0A143HIU6_MICTH|nr:Trk system potassium transporter TrkA [Microbulbifer thermotolerans]AMX01192.1 potassium transporter peripheral membrane component [Microbulbifer thermotolerans]MCX2778493.1 Trk system potassium transporter TrkA [Microbulbifer thermotolerans]MCX2782971.1 Trk system potassium transporter TrkA [Microbulbifer thermotolerans]MCX2793977.1 Trk system potassium transporter TrkA [Microbulbifer thermotolerans]MCX2801681.1 Trk system potassium transporter TrkA [Microbulbifer thermotolerans]